MHGQSKQDVIRRLSNRWECFAMDVTKGKERVKSKRITRKEQTIFGNSRD